MTCKGTLSKLTKKQHHGSFIRGQYHPRLQYQAESWVARVKLLQEKHQGKAQVATVLPKKNAYELHTKLGHPSEEITHATVKSIGILVTCTFKQCEDCTLRKVRIGRVSKMAVICSKIFGESLFFDVNLPSTPIFGGKALITGH